MNLYVPMHIRMCRHAYLLVHVLCTHVLTNSYRPRAYCMLCITSTKSVIPNGPELRATVRHHAANLAALLFRPTSEERCGAGLGRSFLGSLRIFSGWRAWKGALLSMSALTRSYRRCLQEYVELRLTGFECIPEQGPRFEAQAETENLYMQTLQTSKKT